MANEPRPIENAVTLQLIALRISGAAELVLAADVDLFALDTRDFSDDGEQADPFEWTDAE